MYAVMELILSIAAIITCVHAHSGVSIHEHIASASFVKPLEFHHRLRVCNAYPSYEGLDVYLNQARRLTGTSSMAYKSCRDFLALLKSGDRIDFKFGDFQAGTFSAYNLPTHDATLFLVIHRRDTLSTAAAFESHIFASLSNSQVAIIDTYKGREKATPTIQDAFNSSRTEELRYKTVVAISEGQYHVSLHDVLGNETSHAEFVALNHESYVVMRTGVETHRGDFFPQELVVFPQSDPKMLHFHSGVGPVMVPMACILAVVGHLLTAVLSCR